MFMKVLDYTIIRRPRRKTVSIIVRPDRQVHIVVPAALPDSRIAAIAERKREWIIAKLEELRNCEQQHQEHLFRDGEVFFFLGRPLKLALGDGRGHIRINECKIEAEVPVGLQGGDRSSYVQRRLERFFMARAADILKAKAHEFGEHYDLAPPYVAVKDYSSRWGCCFGDGRIYFNWRIIMAPERIIDYVVIHELCHLRQPNHSPQYWALVAGIVPDWKERRAWLRRNGHALRL